MKTFISVMSTETNNLLCLAELFLLLLSRYNITLLVCIFWVDFTKCSGYNRASLFFRIAPFRCLIMESAEVSALFFLLFITKMGVMLLLKSTFLFGNFLQCMLQYRETRNRIFRK